MTPSDIVLSACERGLKGISITDRYSVDGSRQAAYIACDLPISVVPGVEIDSFYDGQDIRILGYGINTEDQMLLDVLNGLCNMSYEACSNICTELRKQGFQINMSTLFDRFGCHMITRDHIAYYMAENGFVKNTAEAFKKYIGKGACAYVPEYKMSPKQTCTLIGLAGGLSVLAYPGDLEFENNNAFRRMLYELKSSGLNGIEVMHPDHTSHAESFFRSEALSCGFLAFGGSDFMGELSPGVEIGTGRGTLMVPDSILKCIPGRYGE